MKLAIKIRWWWHTPLIPALGKQRQAQPHEVETTLVYRVSSWAARATQKCCLKKQANRSTTEKVWLLSLVALVRKTAASAEYRLCKRAESSETFL